MKTSTLVAIAWMVFFLPAPGLGSEVFQWTDSSGVIHFTDDYYATPDTLRGTPNLVVRANLVESPASSNATSSAVTQPIVTNGKLGNEMTRRVELQELQAKYPDETGMEALPDVTIVVVNNFTPHAKKSPCRGSHACSVRFKPDFNDRQYIHPSVFNGGSRQYIQPGLFRSGPK